MTFKWKIINPPYRDQIDGIELQIPGVECVFETGSGDEALGVFENENSAFTKIFGRSPMASIDFDAIKTPAAPIEGEVKTRTRGPNKPKVDAVAPAPLPVPTTGATAATLPPNALPAPAVADLTIPADGSVPAFLARPAAPPPPLPTAVAPPIAPTAPSPPPVGVLGPKVVAALETHKSGNVVVDPEGQLLADWLATAGLTIKGMKYDEACRAVLMTSDEKLKGVAAAFGVV